MGFPGGSDGKESACNAGDLGLIPGLGRFPGEGNGNPLQYSSMENPADRGAWWATVHGVTKESDKTWQKTTATRNSRNHFLKEEEFGLCSLCDEVSLQVFDQKRLRWWCSFELN